MESNGLGKWRFRVNEKLVSAASVSIRGVLDDLMNNINSDDDRDIISFGNGDPSIFPIFRPPIVVENALIDVIRSAQHNCYSPTVGIPKARRAVAEYISRDLPHQIPESDVFLCVGCTQAIEILMEVMARTGSNILLPRPGYPHYAARAAYSGLEIRYFDLLPEKSWEVDLESIKMLADENTAAMIITNPGNPCGNVYTYDHLKRIAETAQQHGILLIADEVYAHVTFERSFVSLGTFASIAPVLIIGSLSKRWVLPGWRLGWIAVVDPTNVLHKSGVVKWVKNYIAITVDPPTIVQAAVPQIIEETDDSFFSNVLDVLREDVCICSKAIEEMPCITCPYKPEGSMFSMDISDDMDFSLKLAKEESVIVFPAFLMGMNNWVRLTFACDPSILKEGLGRMKSFCERHAELS